MVVTDLVVIILSHAKLSATINSSEQGVVNNIDCRLAFLRQEVVLKNQLDGFGMPNHVVKLSWCPAVDLRADTSLNLYGEFCS
mgnify:CR=1 FL=1